jgi:hypothetical protein
MDEPQIINAPWDIKQVRNLNAFQAAGFVLPFFCESCRGKLYATKESWICIACGHRQMTTYDHVANGSLLAGHPKHHFFLETTQNIILVNYKTKKGAAEKEAINIARPSALGNPWTHIPSFVATHAQRRVSTREEAIARYDLWIREVLKSSLNSPQKVEFEMLWAHYQKTNRLVMRCACTPAACHGDVLKRLLFERITQQA